MCDRELLAEAFEANRSHLRGVAYRMLGSLSEADDAVQETWFRLSRTDAGSIENLRGWLTTVVGRVCLDMLRTRKLRREEFMGAQLPEPAANNAAVIDPEEEAVLADSVGLAMLVVLETLSPAERLAFVLHDMFAVSFDEIASITGRSSAAARQLASRARRRVRGVDITCRADLARQREVVDAYLAAARRGDFDALLELLDPDVVLRADAAAVPVGKPREIRSPEVIARRAIAGGARAAQAMLVDGEVGVVIAPGGRLMMVLLFTVEDGKIVEMEAVADPERLGQFRFAVLGG